MRAALVIGHNREQKGAYSYMLGQYEYEYYKDIAGIVAELAPEIDIYERMPVGGYQSEMRPVVNSINKNRYDLVLELHFNSAADTRAKGALCLVHKSSSTGKAIARKFLTKLHEKYGSGNRGLIEIASSRERGGYGICMTKCPYILIEPFFANNSECLKFKGRREFAEFIIEFIKEMTA